MQWSHEHLELKRTTKRIVDEHVNPFVDEWEDAGQFPAHQVMKVLGDAGLLGISRPEAYGGLALDYSYEIAGSDVANVKTYARCDGDDYVISGSKMWTTNGIQADWMCLLANTSQDNAPHRNKSLIVLPLNLPGVTRHKLKKLGLHSSDTAQIFFDDVRVPARHLIGEENKGFGYQMGQFQEERLYVVARSIGLMEDAIADTIDYVRERKAFGRSIIENQFVHFKLAEMQTEIEALRALLHKAVEAYAAGEDVTTLASMAKYKMGRLAEWIPGECLRFWGGQGFMHENRISRTYRDMKLAAIGGGANEVMLQVIAKKMGIL